MNTTPDRLRRNHTYTRTLDSGTTEYFRVEHISTRPDGTMPFAYGWKGRPGSVWYARCVPAVETLGWADITPTPDASAALIADAADRTRYDSTRIDAALQQPLAQLLDALTDLASSYPEMAAPHDRDACDDYACEVMGRALDLARAISSPA